MYFAISMHVASSTTAAAHAHSLSYSVGNVNTIDLSHMFLPSLKPVRELSALSTSNTSHFPRLQSDRTTNEPFRRLLANPCISMHHISSSFRVSALRNDPPAICLRCFALSTHHISLHLRMNVPPKPFSAHTTHSSAHIYTLL